MVAKHAFRPIGVMVVSLLATVLTMLPINNTVHAKATDQIKNGYKNAGGTADNANVDNLETDINTVINTMLFIVGVLAVAMIIFSGIRYITAHGDKQQVESAKNTLIYSVVGLVIAIIAYAIVNYVIGRF